MPRLAKMLFAALIAALFGAGSLPVIDRVAAAPTAGPPAPAVDAASGITCEMVPVPGRSPFELCTHGPDVVQGLPPANPAPAAPTDPALAPAATPGIKCYGDGVSGMRVQAVYALPPGATDRSATAFPQIAGYASQIEDEVSKSAQQTGGERHMRFVTSPYSPDGCDLNIIKVRLTDPDTVDTFSDTIADMLVQGHDRSDRIYLMWFESTAICGVGNLITDDRPLSLNANSYGVRFTRVDRPCWGIAETHELGHNLGGVQRSAPHATTRGHCSDEYDLMCYDDDQSGPTTMDFSNSCSRGLHGQDPCDPPETKGPCYGTGDVAEPGSSGPGTGNNRRWDCNHDDYFHTNPPPGNYLATHWNIANHPVLAQTDSADASGRGAFHPLARPVRIVDTRLASKGLIWDIGREFTAAPTFPSEQIPFGTGRLKSDYHYVMRTIGFDQAGAALITPPTLASSPTGVPNVGVGAVALNITVIDPSVAGFLSVRPYDYDGFAEVPAVSNINYSPRQTIPNSVTVTVPGDGTLDIYTSGGNPFVIVDVAGWYSDGSGTPTTKGSFHELTPARLMDTRSNFGGTVLNTATTAVLKVTGQGVPETHVAGVVLNVTVAEPSTSSFLTVWPTGQPQPTASNLNYTSGGAVANLVIVGVGTDGKVNFFNETGRAHLIVDLLGWFDDGHESSPPGSTFRAIEPVRAVDTRNISQPALAATATRAFKLRGGTVPDSASVKAVIANVAAVGPTGAGYLTTFPADKPLPIASTVNFGPNENRANQAFITLAGDGRANVFNFGGTTHTLIDVAGYFTS